MKQQWPHILAFSIVAAILAPALSAAEKVKLTRDGDAVRVDVDGKHFTTYLAKGNHKPILYPVLGPSGVAMTRNYPMKQVDGEAKDHPHHRSIWYTHGEVNGISFWHEGKNAGVTVHEEFVEVSSGDRGVLTTKNKWVGPDGKTVCTDVRTLTFRTRGDVRMIDYDVTLHASNGKVTLGDTKEGTMGIRTHPNLRLTNSNGVTTANGKALNASGDRDKSLWGKRAKWVAYWGKIDGKEVGVAIFDHPTNPRHPTWWHARDYGLVAANAFGVHNFERKPKGTGDFVIEAGKSARFRFRFVFHDGSAESAKVADLFGQYAAD